MSEARLYVSALGVYEAYINGRRVAVPHERRYDPRTPLKPPAGPTTRPPSTTSPTTSPTC
ncbi:alpha-L-rhamnosidase N-terminal domain-containing protein [Streptomyces sp. L7]